jgi:hypothetical protein
MHTTPGIGSALRPEDLERWRAGQREQLLRLALCKGTEAASSNGATAGDPRKNDDPSALRQAAAIVAVSRLARRRRAVLLLALMGLTVRAVFGALHRVATEYAATTAGRTRGGVRTRAHAGAGAATTMSPGTGKATSDEFSPRQPLSRRAVLEHQHDGEFDGANAEAMKVADSGADRDEFDEMEMFKRITTARRPPAAKKSVAFGRSSSRSRSRSAGALAAANLTRKGGADRLVRDASAPTLTSSAGSGTFKTFNDATSRGTNQFSATRSNGGQTGGATAAASRGGTDRAVGGAYADPMKSFAANRGVAAEQQKQKQQQRDQEQQRAADAEAAACAAAKKMYKEFDACLTLVLAYAVHFSPYSQAERRALATAAASTTQVSGGGGATPAAGGYNMGGGGFDTSGQHQPAGNGLVIRQHASAIETQLGATARRFPGGYGAARAALHQSAVSPPGSAGPAGGATASVKTRVASVRVRDDPLAWTVDAIAEGDLFFFSVRVAVIDAAVAGAIVAKARAHYMHLRKLLSITPRTQLNRRHMLNDMVTTVMPCVVDALQTLQRFLQSGLDSDRVRDAIVIAASHGAGGGDGTLGTAAGSAFAAEGEEDGVSTAGSGGPAMSMSSYLTAQRHRDAAAAAAAAAAAPPALDCGNLVGCVDYLVELFGNPVAAAAPTSAASIASAIASTARGSAACGTPSAGAFQQLQQQQQQQQQSGSSSPHQTFVSGGNATNLMMMPRRPPSPAGSTSASSPTATAGGFGGGGGSAVGGRALVGSPVTARGGGGIVSNTSIYAARAPSPTSAGFGPSPDAISNSNASRMAATTSGASHQQLVALLNQTFGGAAGLNSTFGSGGGGFADTATAAGLSFALMNGAGGPGDATPSFAAFNSAAAAAAAAAVAENAAAANMSFSSGSGVGAPFNGTGVRLPTAIVPLSGTLYS